MESNLITEDKQKNKLEKAFGVSPPTPDWGLMISNARGLMSFAYWSVIAPIVGLSSLIIGINLTADAFAKALGIDRSTKAPV